MKNTIALAISAIFLLATTGLATAQTTTTPPPAATPAPSTTTAPAPSKAEQKAKKDTAKAEKQLSACMAKAGTDEAKKASCQKKHDAAVAKIEAAEKKAMEKQQPKK